VKRLATVCDREKAMPIDYSDQAHLNQLFALMPEASKHVDPPESFDPDMQLTVNDFNSFEAAKVTLEKFGASVKSYAWGFFQLYCEFSDGDQGGNAVVFYNRLPKNMAKYKRKN
jgi:hypothetical protein